jgi:hypothetical protein
LVTSSTALTTGGGDRFAAANRASFTLSLATSDMDFCAIWRVNQDLFLKMVTLAAINLLPLTL